MMVFTVAHDEEKNQTIFTGNVSPAVALQLVQQVVIGEAVRKSKEEQCETQPSA